MRQTAKAKIHYIVLGILAAICFIMLSGFKLPSPPEPGGNYQFFKEKDSAGVWVFEPDTGTSKFFDIEKGIVITNSYQMDSITVKSDAKSVRTATE
jgi:hypothetical protein